MANKEDIKDALEDNETPMEGNEEKAGSASFIFSPLYFRLSTFALLLCLTFSYFLYFSHQLSESKSHIFTRISKINAIKTPYPLQFLSVIGHQEYRYKKRSEALREEFQNLRQHIDDTQLSDEDLTMLGQEIKRVITQVAFYYPYKRMLKFDKEGSASFDPNKRDSIFLSNKMEIGFLKHQLYEIGEWNHLFTNGLKENQEIIERALVLASGLKDEYAESSVSEYMNTLLAYLEKHYDMSIPLLGEIHTYEFFSAKLGMLKVTLLLILLMINFIFGLLIPLFSLAKMKSKWLELIALVTFVIGIIILLKESYHTITY